MFVHSMYGLWVILTQNCGRSFPGLNIAPFKKTSSLILCVISDILISFPRTNFILGFDSVATNVMQHVMQIYVIQCLLMLIFLVLVIYCQ